MQAILVADYSFTPFEYWRNVSAEARKFIQRCLTIDPVLRMTAHEALQHPWITGEMTEAPRKTGAEKQDARGTADLLPTVKKNFHARRTLHAAIDTIRAINQLRAGGTVATANATGGASQAHERAKAAGLVNSDKGKENANQNAMQDIKNAASPHSEDVHEADGQLPDAQRHSNARGHVFSHVDPRGNAKGQSPAQIAEQQRRVQETTTGMWQKRS